MNLNSENLQLEQNFPKNYDGIKLNKIFHPKEIK